MTRRVIAFDARPELCVLCQNYYGGKEGDYCTAFPIIDDDGHLSGIPEAIRSGDFRHTQPYPGDHGIQFEPKPGYDAEGKKIET
jgi:hypothetical protein